MMLSLTLVLSLAVAPQGQWQTDTTFAVPAGTGLQLHNVTGDVEITAWDRQEVRVQADHSSRLRLDVELTGSNLRLQMRSERGLGNVGGVADYRITVPVSMAINLNGMYSDVTVRGTRSDIRVQTVSGDVDITGGGGTLSLTTIDGMIRVRDGRGRLEATSTSDDIVVNGFDGEVQAEAVSGDILLHRITSRDVYAETVSGRVEYAGTVRDDGSYLFGAHSGEVLVAIPEGANVLIRAAAMMGDIEASFALPQADRRGRSTQTLRLGTGSATMELNTFSGDVRLVRPSEMQPPNDMQED